MNVVYYLTQAALSCGIIYSKVMEQDERGGMSPEYAGNYVAKVALREHSKPLVALGLSYKGAAVLAKLLPRRLSNWIVGLIYAK